ncbi:MAG TPA: ABC transporter ATP-binding protein, partial [Clostridiales bacterium]|nr:ABC transporter ATP-binding protein [Clostridiales bacterium]
EFENLTKSYGNWPVLSNLNFSLEEGKVIGVVGPNGCGKTTLFKIIVGLINDYKGTVRIDGHTPDEYTRSIISYLPERTYLNDWMKAGDAIDTFADFFSDFDKQKAEELLARFQLTRNMRMKTMSKGMQEKLHLSLVMSRKAKLYVLDEPLSGVDPAARETIIDVILRNYNPGSSVLLSTHLIYDVENLFDHVIMMRPGSIVVNDSAENIRTRTGKTLDEYFREVFR